MEKHMKKMLEIAKNDVVAYAIELDELKEERKQLVRELKRKGECIIANKEMQSLNDYIEGVETSIEMVMRFIRNESKEGGIRMNIKEILDCVECATTELEYVSIMDLPDGMRQDFSEAYGLLLHIRMDLEMELDMEEVE